MEAFVTAAKNGDKEAFVQLIRINKQSMYKAAWVYLRNEQDIADALQNTILSCYEKIQGLREVKYFKTWLMRILINECKDILRQKNHDTELDNFSEGVHCENLDLCEWKQLLLCLDEESRKIVELYYFDEFSVKEIGNLLEMNSNTVSTKLSRARAKLKKGDQEVKTMDEKEIRKILKEETVIPDNIDKAMEDVLKGILDSPDERMSSTKNLIVKSDKGRSKNSGNKKKIIRILLPVAAVLGVSTGVLATKLGWLHKELEQQGVTEQEAVQMVVTEPDSTAENVEDVTSYHITPKERDWNQSMLSVTEAYFDGSGFSFLGDPSGAVENYTLSCRDHATVNGEDALATLNKIDGEDLYYGHITLYDDALTEKILNEDSQVEVSMTIQAYPDYNGRIYYTWKDDEAFRKIFKTGSFTDSEGMLAYALPAEDAYRGYTPQTLTVTLPLNDEVRDIIEKYRKEGKMQAEDTGVEPISDSTEESTQETTDSENPSDATGANEKYDPETAVLQVKESHVTASLPGKSGTLTIEADITGSTTDVSKGILEKRSVSEEEICSWFGGEDGWEKSETDETGWENKEKGLQLFISDGRIQCDGLSEKDLGALENNTEGELNIINQLLSKANLTGTSVRKSISNMTEGYDYYDTEILLNGIPVGGLSQHGYLGTAGFGPAPEDCYFNIPIPLQLKVEETVTMLSMEEIMKSVEQYVKEGKIGLFTEQDTAEETESTTIPVTKICLEYYIDETADGITYRPVWSFRCPYQWKDSPDEQELFYIDGETGALIRDAFGW